MAQGSGLFLHSCSVVLRFFREAEPMGWRKGRRRGEKGGGREGGGESKGSNYYNIACPDSKLDLSESHGLKYMLQLLSALVKRGIFFLLG